MDELASEFGLLSGWDEFPIHQTQAPVRLVETTDPRAFERYWFTAHALDSAFFLVMGIGFYPNLGTADAYAILVHSGQHTTVRAYRPLSANRAELSVGPFNAEPVSPFAEWRLTLGSNELDFRFDLRWRDTKRANFRKMLIPSIPGVFSSRLLHDWSGYETFGTVEGMVEFQGKKHELSADEFRGSRDHHWGVRNGVGGQRFALHEPPMSHFGQWVEFPEWSIWGDQVLYNIGSPQPGAGTSRIVERKLRFDPLTKHLLGGIVTNRLENGEVREIVYEQIGNQVAYLRCGGYAGPDGRGTPNGNHHHGSALGEKVEGEIYDISNPAVRAEIGGFEDHLCRATCNGLTTVGILECRNPALFEMCAKGVPGFSILQT